MRAALLLLAWLWIAPAGAGQACTEHAVTEVQTRKALALAGQVQAALEAQQLRAALIARVGADVSQHGLRWTHAGLVFRAEGDARWTILHKLNRCGSDQAGRFRQGLANFFLDDPHEYSAWLLPPSPILQQLLLDEAAGDAGHAVDEPRYSVIAYPFSLDYQNSNGWLLETIARVQGAGVGRRAAQDFLRRTGYAPDVITISALERLGGSLFKANLAFFDHPLAERLRGRYSVVSVESIARYLRDRDQITEPIELNLEAS